MRANLSQKQTKIKKTLEDLIVSFSILINCETTTRVFIIHLHQHSTVETNLYKMPSSSIESHCTFTLASDVTAGGLPSEEEIAKDLESSDASVR